MRIESAHIKNFRLLEDVDLQFSVDPQKPLTVIRAENGSGKTSILYALRWALYGTLGVPSGMRLSSSLLPVGKRTVVQVRVEFTTTDPYLNEDIKYRLIRSCEETSADNSFLRSSDLVRLYQRTPDGEKEIEEGKEALIDKILPISLSDTFFTNGDDVQHFISGGQSQRQHQEAVHKAIRQLLGHDDVERVEKNLRSISKKFKSELAKSGGTKLQKANEELEKIQDDIELKNLDLSKIQDRILRVERQIRDDERELNDIRGIGDLDNIQVRIEELKDELSILITQEKDIRNQVRDLLKSETISWFFLQNTLNKGLGILEDLADRKIIPGTAIETLKDRLNVGVCICGVNLVEGSEQYKYLVDLIDEQQQKTPDQQQLTSLLHRARINEQVYKNSVEGDKSFEILSENLKAKYSQCMDSKRRKTADLSTEEKKRSQIDSVRIQELAERISVNKTKHSKLERHYGQNEGELHGLEEQEKLAITKVNEEEDRANLNHSNKVRSKVANDMWLLASNTLKRLKSEYVGRVSERMNDIFLRIVGSNPESYSAVFVKVSISEQFDIIVHTQGGNTLDVDYELNGASQRALTLSFIWALMEVASRQAPRIIDAPLGMTSGAVKERMVDILTNPVDESGLPYQIVLLMTRSEIRDIESLIDKRAGRIMTLSCSKDYPRDLVNDWGQDYPVVRVCPCSHIEICDMCVRQQDNKKQLFLRKEE